MKDQLLKLAELYINSELKQIGKTRITYPTKEQIEKRKQELIEEVEGIIGIGTLEDKKLP